LVRFNGGEAVKTASQTRRALDTKGATMSAERGAGGDVHVHFHGPVYAKSEMDFEKMLSGALQNLKRKGKLPK
jgi:hypothetical protein